MDPAVERGLLFRPGRLENYLLSPLVSINPKGFAAFSLIRCVLKGSIHPTHSKSSELKVWRNYQTDLLVLTNRRNRH